MAADYYTPSPATRAGGGSSLVLILVALVAAALGYMWWRQQQKETPEVTRAQAQQTTAGPMTPAERARVQQDMVTCKARGISTGSCEVDPADNTVHLHCNAGYYGKGCANKCATGTGRALVYKAGFEEGAPSAASCVCPSASHFRDADVVNGCRLGTLQGSACETGWHGEKCDQTGAHKDCGAHGKQSATTGDCVCTDGYEGELCQRPKDYCTSTDAGATYDAATDACKCTGGWSGAQCTSKITCGAQGTYDATTNKCVCKPGFTGARCTDIDGTTASLTLTNGSNSGTLSLCKIHDLKNGANKNKGCPTLNDLYPFVNGCSKSDCFKNGNGTILMDSIEMPEGVGLDTYPNSGSWARDVCTGNPEWKPRCNTARSQAGECTYTWGNSGSWTGAGDLAGWKVCSQPGYKITGCGTDVEAC